MQPETLQSLLDRLNRFTISDSEFKDIQIKSVELIKQLFPTDSAGAVYQINTLRLYGKNLYEAKTELISILEAKLQTIERAEQNRLLIAKNVELQRKQNEENRIRANENRENEYILQLQKDLNEAYEKLNTSYDNNKELGKIIEEYETEIDDLKGKAKIRYKNHRLIDATFWGVVIAICSLFLLFGYYFGYNRFDSEKLSIQKQRDQYKNELDSVKKVNAPHFTKM